jgi:hypothetical protein
MSETKRIVVVTLEFELEEDEARGEAALDECEGIVDDVLDNGTFQDAINEMASDRGHGVRIASVVCGTEPVSTRVDTEEAPAAPPPRPALVGTDALLVVRAVRDALYNYSRREDGADIPDVVVDAMGELTGLLERGPTIEPSYVLDDAQVLRLVTWANAPTTAWGPGFDGALLVAQRVRAFWQATLGVRVNEGVYDGLEGAPNEELVRQLRDARQSLLTLGRAMARRVDERQAVVELYGTLLGELFPGLRATGTALAHAQSIVAQCRALMTGAADVVRLPRYALRNALVEAHRRGGGWSEDDEVATKDAEHHADDVMRVGLLVAPPENAGRHVAPLELVTPKPARSVRLTTPQKILLADLVKDGRVEAPTDRLRAPFVRCANRLISLGYATWVDRGERALMPTDHGRARLEER